MYYRDEDARWMHDHIRGIELEEDTQSKVGVASVEDKLQEARLRWFRHVKGRCMDTLVRKLAMDGIRQGRSRPKKY